MDHRNEEQRSNQDQRVSWRSEVPSIPLGVSFAMTLSGGKYRENTAIIDREKRNEIHTRKIEIKNAKYQEVAEVFKEGGRCLSSQIDRQQPPIISVRAFCWCNEAKNYHQGQSVHMRTGNQPSQKEVCFSIVSRWAKCQEERYGMVSNEAIIEGSAMNRKNSCKIEMRDVKIQELTEKIKLVGSRDSVLIDRHRANDILRDELRTELRKENESNSKKELEEKREKEKRKASEDARKLRADGRGEDVIKTLADCDGADAFYILMQQQQNQNTEHKISPVESAVVVHQSQDDDAGYRIRRPDFDVETVNANEPSTKSTPCMDVSDSSATSSVEGKTEKVKTPDSVQMLQMTGSIDGVIAKRSKERTASVASGHTGEARCPVVVALSSLPSGAVKLERIRQVGGGIEREDYDRGGGREQMAELPENRKKKGWWSEPIMSIVRTVAKKMDECKKPIIPSRASLEIRLTPKGAVQAVDPEWISQGTAYHRPYDLVSLMAGHRQATMSHYVVVPPVDIDRRLLVGLTRVALGLAGYDMDHVYTACHDPIVHPLSKKTGEPIKLHAHAQAQARYDANLNETYRCASLLMRIGFAVLDLRRGQKVYEPKIVFRSKEDVVRSGALPSVESAISREAFLSHLGYSPFERNCAGSDDRMRDVSSMRMNMDRYVALLSGCEQTMNLKSIKCSLSASIIRAFQSNRKTQIKDNIAASSLFRVCWVSGCEFKTSTN